MTTTEATPAILAAIEGAAADARWHEEQAAIHAKNRDDKIRQALGARRFPVSEICAASGLTKTRIYQIRDNTR